MQLLTQMGTQMNQLAATITGSREEVAGLFEQGSQRLASSDNRHAGRDPRTEPLFQKAVRCGWLVAQRTTQPHRLQGRNEDTPGGRKTTESMR